MAAVPATAASCYLEDRSKDAGVKMMVSLLTAFTPAQGGSRQRQRDGIRHVNADVESIFKQHGLLQHPLALSLFLL